MASALLCLESSGNLCSVAVTGFDREAYLQSEPGYHPRPEDHLRFLGNLSVENGGTGGTSGTLGHPSGRSDYR